MERLQQALVNRVAVFGAGAVGCFLSGLIEAGGQATTLIGRPAVLDPIRARGLRVGVEGRDIQAMPTVETTVDHVQPGIFNLILLTVKAYAVKDAVKDIKRILAPQGMVVSFQNGVGSDKDLLENLYPEQLIAATLTTPVNWEEPSLVRMHRSGGGIAWSTYASGMDSHLLTEVLGRSSLPVREIESANGLKWSKLLLNNVGSAQSAILDIDMSLIAADRLLFNIERESMLEAMAAMEAARIPVVDLPGYRVLVAARVMRLPAWISWKLLGRRVGAARGARAPGMRADVQGGRPTEVAYLNGAVVDLATTYGIPAPVNHALYSLVEEITADSKSKDYFRGNPIRLLRRVAESKARFN